MAKLVLSQDGIVTREFPIEEEEIGIGRKASNAIQIEDISISGAHARVIVEKNFYMDNLKDVYIEDCGSTNGTYVNGKQIKKHMLRHGDVIQIGRHDFKYFDEDAPDFDKTVVLSPVTDEMIETAKAAKESGKSPAEAAAIAAEKATSPASSSEPETGRKAYVKVLSGPKAGKELELVKSYTSLGNSGTMIVIAKRQKGYFVSHVTGKSGQQGKFPTVNDNVIGAQSVPLQGHDLIDIDGLKLEFFVR